MNDIGFDIACPQPAGQPEAVTASLERHGPDGRELRAPSKRGAKRRLRASFRTRSSHEKVRTRHAIAETMRENIESPPPSSPEPKPKAETRERERARNRARKSPYAAAVANRMHLIDLARVYGFEHLTIKSLDLPVFHLDDPGLPPEPEKPKPEPEPKRK